MTITELLEYATSIGKGENYDLVTAIFAGIVTSEIQIVNFTGF